MHLGSLSLLVTLSLTAAVPGCLAEAELGEDTARQDSAVNARFQDNLDALHAAGIVGVLGQLDVGHRRFVARSGTARIDAARPVPKDARFRIGSNTKTFVAVVILQLVGEGRIGLDDTVERWLPGVVAGHGNDATRITIRHLLQHTSGIHNYTQDLLSDFTAEDYLEARFRHVAPEELVAIAMQHPPDFAPGTAWSYSNTNYILAGMIIKQVTGRDWRTEVHRRILAPLRLEDTSEPADRPGLPGPHASGYEQFVPDGALTDVTLMNHTWADAAGSMISTTSDLSRFWRALQRGQLLRPAQLAEMRRTVPATELEEVWPGVRYGLGIIEAPTSCGERLWSHFGDTLGYSTRNAVSDDGDRVATVSLSTQLAGEAGFNVLVQNLQLLDDAMCAGR
jgi:D-alanyl-D-alanine carboxypeptidase